MPDTLQLPLSDLASLGAQFDQYFGLWAVEDARFMALLREIRGTDLLRHVATSAFDGAADAERARAEMLRAAAPAVAPVADVPGEQRAASGEGYDEATVREGREAANIAVIRLSGTMTKYGSSMSSAGSSVRTRRAIRNAARAEDVDGILLVIDSPGGTVAGTADLAADVADARDRKPVYVHGEDLVASAAYWVASQADRVFANNETALVGSIGTFIGLYDLSKAAEKEGIRAVVIKAGDMKGAGFEGTPITDDQVKYWQGIVDRTQAEFTASVARGRRLNASDVPATGRVYPAGEALRLGLIDGIQSLEATVQQLAAAAIARRSAGGLRRASARASESINQASTKTMEKENNVEAAEATEQTEAKAAAPAGAPSGAPSGVPGGAQASDVAEMRAEIARLKAERRADAVVAIKSAFAGKVPGAAVDDIAQLAEAAAPHLEGTGVDLFGSLRKVADSLTPMVAAGPVQTTDVDAKAEEEKAKAVQNM